MASVLLTGLDRPGGRAGPGGACATVLVAVCDVQKRAASFLAAALQRAVEVRLLRQERPCWPASRRAGLATGRRAHTHSKGAAHPCDGDGCGVPGWQGAATALPEARPWWPAWRTGRAKGPAGCHALAATARRRCVPSDSPIGERSSSSVLGRLPSVRVSPAPPARPCRRPKRVCARPCLLRSTMRSGTLRCSSRPHCDVPFCYVSFGRSVAPCLPGASRPSRRPDVHTPSRRVCAKPCLLRSTMRSSTQRCSSRRPDLHTPSKADGRGGVRVRAVAAAAARRPRRGPRRPALRRGRGGTPPLRHGEALR